MGPCKVLLLQVGASGGARRLREVSVRVLCPAERLGDRWDEPRDRLRDLGALAHLGLAVARTRGVASPDHPRGQARREGPKLAPGPFREVERRHMDQNVSAREQGLAVTCDRAQRRRGLPEPGRDLQRKGGLGHCGRPGRCSHEKINLLVELLPCLGWPRPSRDPDGQVRVVLRASSASSVRRTWAQALSCRNPSDHDSASVGAPAKVLRLN